MRIPRDFFTRDSFVERVIKEMILKDENNGTWFAGSYVAWLMKDSRKYNDIDLFFKDSESFIDMDSRFDNSTSFDEIFRCPRGELVTYKPNIEGKNVQLVAKSFYASPEDCIDTFDFNVCRCAYDIEKEQIVTTEECMNDLTQDNISLHKVTYPVATLRRLIKYGKKGYTIRPQLIKELILYIQTMELTEENMAFYID